MEQKVDEQVEVWGRFGTKGWEIEKILWAGREYGGIKLGYHHTFFRGRTIIHVFSVASDTVFFRLELDSESLKFRLTEIAENDNF